MTEPITTPDEAGTSMPDDQDPTQPSVVGRLLKFTLALVLGLGAGWGVQQGVVWWQSQGSDSQAFVPTSPAIVQSATVTAPSATSAQPFPAWLVIGSQAHSLDQGQISLPSGSRFQIWLRSPVTGEVSVSAVNPAGETSGTPLWVGTVGNGAEAMSPMLRLEGAKGRETLVVVIRPLDGQAPLIRNLHLWHL